MTDRDDQDREALIRRSLLTLDELRKDPDFVRAEKEIDEVVANLRDSNIDLEDIFDLEMMLREHDPERRAQRRREALFNPALDAAIAKARAEGAPGLLPRPIPLRRVSAPSPWVNEQPTTTIDTSDLPSAAVMPVSRTPRKPARNNGAVPPATGRHSRSTWPALIMTGTAAFGAVIFAYVMFVRPGERKLPTASQGASATNASSIVAFTALPAPSAVPPNIEGNEPSSAAVPTARLETTQTVRSSTAPERRRSPRIPAGTVPSLPGPPVEATTAVAPPSAPAPSSELFNPTIPY